MTTPKIKAIVAMASNRVIGKDGQLPWKLSEDLKWFKKLTMGCPIVMGRKTMDSLGKPLPGRRNLVLSRTIEVAPEGFELLKSIEQISTIEAETVFIIGGAEIYHLLFPHCDEVYLSFVFHPYEGDTQLGDFEHFFDLKNVLYADSDFELRHLFRKPNS